MSAPVLSYPRFGSGEKFILETDVSGNGLGSILSQCQDGQIHPICSGAWTSKMKKEECKRGEKRREGKKQSDRKKKWALPGIEPMPGLKSS